MKQYREILRTCVQSKEEKEKKDLFRVVRTPERNVIVDLKGKANGRGAYLKKDKEVILKAQKTKILERHLNTKIEDEIYEILLSKI